jgi:hypothetical protein
MFFGVLFTTVVGVGLMALIFDSSRRAYDELTSVNREDRDRER